MTHRVTLTKNGPYWQARWKDDDGFPRAKSLGNRSKVTRRAALALCLDIERQFVTDPTSKGVRRSPVLSAWWTRYESLRGHELDERTLSMHHKTVEYLNQFVGGDFRLDGTASSSSLVLAVNYFGVSELLDGLADALAKGENPAALVIGSVAATQPGADQQPMVAALLAGDETQALALADALGQPHIAYASSKYAVTCEARRKSVQWAAQGIRLNVVAPGAVETPLHQAAKDDARFGKAVREFVAPLGRAGSPAEIAQVVAFLQSTQASFVTGSVMFVDGGMDAMVRAQRF